MVTKIFNCNIKKEKRVCKVTLYGSNNALVPDDLGIFDIIICDGPYGTWPGFWQGSETDWDDFDLDSKEGCKDFRQYYWDLFDIYLEHLKESGSMFIFNYPEGASLIKIVLTEMQIHFRRWITWIYENHFDFDYGTNFKRSQETILYYTKKGNFIFRGEGIPDVFIHPIIKIEDSQFKDGAKPLAIIRRCLEAVHISGGRLLSLFAGSGTDIMAALEYDMDAVGFEFNPKHFEMIVDRLKEHYDCIS